MKPVNLTQAQAQHAEVSALMGGNAASAARELSEQIESLTKENDELRAQVAELTTDRTALADTVDGLEKQLEETSAKLAAAGANVEELNAEIAALKAATAKTKK